MVALSMTSWDTFKAGHTAARHIDKNREHYETLILEYQDLGKDERNDFMRRWEWRPTPELLRYLRDAQFQRDRVELIVAFWAVDHGGNSPPWQCVGDLMAIHRKNAEKYGKELTQERHRRARCQAGQFWLVEAEYTHKVVKRKFAQQLLPMLE